MGSYSKQSIIKVITVLRTPLFAMFVQNRDNIFRLVREGNADRVKQYLAAGGDPDLQGHWHVKSNRTEGYTVRWSLLCEGAAFGHVEVLQLLANAVGVNNVAKMTFALWIATYYGHRSLVEWLLEHTKADIFKCPKSPLLTSAENSHFEVTRYLLDHMFRQQQLESYNPSAMDLDAALSAIIARQADDGRLALHNAAETNDVDKVRELCRSGCIDVDVQDNNGQTSLHIACQMGHNEVADLLIYYGANGLVRNDFGRTCVDVALTYGNQSLIDFMTTLYGTRESTVTSSVSQNSAYSVSCSHHSDLQLSRWNDKLQSYWQWIQLKMGMRPGVTTYVGSQQRAVVDDDDMSISNWDVFVVVVDEIASRLLGKFRRGITFTKASDDRVGNLNEIQYCQFGYKMLTELRFGKALLVSNILRFWEESLNRLLSLVVAGRVNNDLHFLILQAIALFRKLLNDDSDLYLTVVEQPVGEITVEQEFEQSAFLLLDLTRKLAVNDEALITLLHHLKLLYSLPSIEHPKEETGASVSENEVDQWYENNNKKLRKFSRADTESLLLTIAKIQRHFLKNIDLKFLCSMWAAFFAFFAHVRDLERRKQPPGVLSSLLVKAIGAIFSVVCLLWMVLTQTCRLSKNMDYKSAIVVGFVVFLHWVTLYTLM